MNIWSFLNSELNIGSLLTGKCSQTEFENIDESFKNMVQTFNPEMVTAKTSAIIEYRIKRCGDWHVIIANKMCELKQGRSNKPDLCLTTDCKTWMAIAEGLETGEAMYMNRKLCAKGDNNLLMQLSEFFAIKENM